MQGFVARAYYQLRLLGILAAAKQRLVFDTMNKNLLDWNEDQVRHLERHLAESFPNAFGLEITSIEVVGESQWRVFYVYERSNNREGQSSDYITGRLVHNGFEDFALLVG